MNEKTISRGPGLQQESLTDLLGQLASHSATLVREEMALAKQEFSEKMQALRNGGILVAVGAVAGLLAFATLWAALIIWLSDFLAPEVAAAVTGGGLAMIAAIIGFTGVKKLRKTTAEPIKTVEVLQGR
ncbi:MAG: phage holin family protein [Deltaproteobacteria bacterium]|nr:phage holin family protein [Deltaproteobacteria bacterium]